MRVQLHNFKHRKPFDRVLENIPWGDYLMWNNRVFRRRSEEMPAHMIQNFDEVSCHRLTSGGHYDHSDYDSNQAEGKHRDDAQPKT